MPEIGEGVQPPKSTPNKDCGNHQWSNQPRPQQPGLSIDDQIKRLKEGKKEGDLFEARAVEHNRAHIRDGNDIGAEFPCINAGCSATKEVDHITRDNQGQITKIVQCKADMSKVNGGKGVTIKPKQLREDRKLQASLNAAQHGSGIKSEIEYKLEDGAAAQDAAGFLRKKDPPLIQMVK